ncbi:MAG: hypothetical protein KY445_07880 [Armatimonadetes bacterium]|nr:hypothetical protein [Armatimonadota bacterium]
MTRTIDLEQEKLGLEEVLVLVQTRLPHHRAGANRANVSFDGGAAFSLYDVEVLN